MKQEQRGVIVAKHCSQKTIKSSKCYRVKLCLLIKSYQLNCPFLSLRNRTSLFLSFILIIVAIESGFSLAA